MSWNSDRAQKRISSLLESTPNVKVERFSDEYLPRVRVLAEVAKARGEIFDERPLFNLNTRQGVVVDGVHVYANLINYDQYRLSEGRETEASHRRGLNFLHLHYSACDRVVENSGAQRVDFHGGRMHAVVLEPSGAANAGVRVAKAIILAAQLRELSQAAAEQIRLGDYSSQYRFGIDTGTCVAINSGRGMEPEPLFLGSAANHAAKLAVGRQPGIYLSDRAQAELSKSGVANFGNVFEKNVDGRPTYVLNEANLTQIRELGIEDRAGVGALLETWQTEVRSAPGKNVGTEIHFDFHAHNLPLKTIDYALLMPSNSIRMGMSSIFADLDGYTAYIDGAMSDFGRLSNAVRNLHVIRGELANVIQQDFDGRKVRFIGDCIHGILASGAGVTTNARETVRQTIHCSGGLRSSFEICQNQLPEANQLGLAIGFELGETPVTRLGIRGDRSVRVASSKSTSASEEQQQRCNGVETAIGPEAFREASSNAKAMFGNDFKTDNLDYDSAVLGVPEDIASPAYVSQDQGFRAHSSSIPRKS